MAEAGISCMFSCHQWHHVEKEVCFGNLELRLVLKMNSHQAPRIPWSIVWLVHTTQSTGSKAGMLPELDHLSHAIRDNNKLKWERCLAKVSPGW